MWLDEYIASAPKHYVRPLSEVYHIPNGTVKDLYVQQIARLFPILQPDLRVVLTLPEEVRRQRVVYRGKIDTRDKDVKVAGSRADFFERFLVYTAHQLLNSGKALIILFFIAQNVCVPKRIIWGGHELLSYYRF